MQELLIELFTNPVFLSILASWTLAGLIKFSISAFRREKKSFAWQMFRTGGMPSAHSAAVTALSVSVYWVEGLSTLFFVTAVLSLLVIRDSFGVRLSVGEQAKIINKLAKAEHIEDKVKVVLGHTVWQAVMGIILGGVIAGIVHYYVL